MSAGFYFNGQALASGGQAQGYPNDEEDEGNYYEEGEHVYEDEEDEENEDEEDSEGSDYDPADYDGASSSSLGPLPPMGVGRSGSDSGRGDGPSPSNNTQQSIEDLDRMLSRPPPKLSHFVADDLPSLTEERRRLRLEQHGRAGECVARRPRRRRRSRAEEAQHSVWKGQEPRGERFRRGRGQTGPAQVVDDERARQGAAARRGVQEERRRRSVGRHAATHRAVRDGLHRVAAPRGTEAVEAIGDHVSTVHCSGAPGVAAVTGAPGASVSSLAEVGSAAAANRRSPENHRRLC